MRLSRLPVRWRLVAGFAVAMVVVLAGAGAFVFWRVQYALDHRLDEDLASQTADLRIAAARRSPTAAVAVLGAQGRDAQLLDPGGRVLASGTGLAGRPSLISPAQVRAATRRAVGARRGNLFSPRGAHIWILALPVGARGAGRGSIAVSAVRLDQRDEALRELLVQLALANLIALGLASLVGYRLARAALDPVERYRAQAERIAAGAAGVRLEVAPGPRDEISRLGTTLNAMLTAQERAAERQQQFVDDASHELRTPLSALTAEVDLALRRPRTAEDLEAALRRIAADTARLSALAEELLTLGALGASTSAREPVDARALLHAAADRARGQLDRGEPRMVLVDVPDGLSFAADPALMRRALGNLADNAVRHGAGTIVFSAATVEDLPVPVFVLRVHDQGTGLDEAFLAQAAERFRRGEGSRTGPGTGLGLSLVEAIVDAHAGQLRICANGAHHSYATPNTAFADIACRHAAHGTTVSLLLPGCESRALPVSTPSRSRTDVTICEKPAAGPGRLDPMA